MVLNQWNAAGGSDYDTVEIFVGGMQDDRYGSIQYYDCFGTPIYGDLEVILGSVVICSRQTKGGIGPYIEGNATLVDRCLNTVGSGNNAQTNGVYVYKVTGECSLGVQ